MSQEAKPMHPAPSRENRRACVRREPRGRFKVWCRKGSTGLGPNLALDLLDVSQTGACLVVREPLEPGQEVHIALLGQGHLRPVVTLADIIRCKSLPDGHYEIGVRFRKLLRYADLQHLT